MNVILGSSIPNISYVFAGVIAGASSMLKRTPSALLAMRKCETDVSHRSPGASTKRVSRRSSPGMDLSNRLISSLPDASLNQGISTASGSSFTGFSATRISSSTSYWNLVTPQLNTHSTVKSGREGFTSFG